MRADAKKNYDRLLEVGREVVTEQGAEASLRDVARRADVGLGTLYRTSRLGKRCSRPCSARTSTS